MKTLVMTIPPRLTDDRQTDRETDGCRNGLLLVEEGLNFAEDLVNSSLRVNLKQQRENNWWLIRVTLVVAFAFLS